MEESGVKEETERAANRKFLTDVFDLRPVSNKQVSLLLCRVR